MHILYLLTNNIDWATSVLSLGYVSRPYLETKMAVNFRRELVLENATLGSLKVLESLNFNTKI